VAILTRLPRPLLPCNVFREEPTRLGGGPALLGGIPTLLGGVPALLGGTPALLGGTPALLGESARLLGPATEQLSRLSGFLRGLAKVLMHPESLGQHLSQRLMSDA
jgi:hypothetical protein